MSEPRDRNAPLLLSRRAFIAAVLAALARRLKTRLCGGGPAAAASAFDSARNPRPGGPRGGATGAPIDGIFTPMVRPPPDKA